MSESQESKKKDETIESESTGENDSLYSQESVYRQQDDPGLHSTISQMSTGNLQRYETFRRSNLPKAAVKKFINSVIGQAVNPNIIIGVCGLCKVFIGEVVNEAKRVQDEAGSEGALLPSHIHEAYRRLYRRMPNLKVFKREPWNN